MTFWVPIERMCDGARQKKPFFSPSFTGQLSSFAPFSPCSIGWVGLAPDQPKHVQALHLKHGVCCISVMQLDANWPRQARLLQPSELPNVPSANGVRVHAISASVRSRSGTCLFRVAGC